MSTKTQTATKPLALPIPNILALWWIPIAALYGGYLYFITASGHGAVDYATFIDIGDRFLAGQEVYVENSYYPLVYVMIFAWLAWLPPLIAIPLWHSLPVVVALLITRRPMVLAFAPLFAHFLGGQTAIVGMVGLWGYMRYRDDNRGGAFLALTLLKPQLGLVPILYAAMGWGRRRGQVFMFGLCAVALFLPAFVLDPSWFWRWAHNGRDLRERAMAGLIPRVVIQFDSGLWFWVVTAMLGASLLWLLWRRGQLTLEVAMLWSFVALPFLHDYDLITLIPVLGASLPLAVALSVPTWGVIVLAYGNDAAWIAATIIGAGLLWYAIHSTP